MYKSATAVATSCQSVTEERLLLGASRSIGEAHYLHWMRNKEVSAFCSSTTVQSCSGHLLDMKDHGLCFSRCPLDSNVDFTDVVFWKDFHHLVTKRGCNIFQSLLLGFAAENFESAGGYVISQGGLTGCRSSRAPRRWCYNRRTRSSNFRGWWRTQSDRLR